MKKILSNFSADILEMTTINKSRTNQLATEAATAIFKQIEKNEAEQVKKKIKRQVIHHQNLQEPILHPLLPPKPNPPLYNQTK